MPKASLTPTVSGTGSGAPGLLFDIDPESAQWSYSLKVNSVDTYGGRVIQVLSRTVDGVSIKGHLPCRHGLDATEYESQFGNMERFERDARAVAEWQAEHKRPHRFSFDALDWSGNVWLTDIGTFTQSHRILNTRHFCPYKSGFYLKSKVFLL